MNLNNFGFNGLTNEEVIEARNKFGINQIHAKRKSLLFNAVKSILKEPMVVLLFVTVLIYFLAGKLSDAIFLSCSIVLVAGISLFQDSRSRNALEKLNDFTRPKCKVLRSGEIKEIKTEDVVVGDHLIVEEGNSIAADGIIIHSNDFSVDESLLTGESFPINKDKNGKDHFIYQGTTVAAGLAVIRVTATGDRTKLAGIGKSIEQISEEKTHLELQINNFVKKMVLVGGTVFFSVWAINYFHVHDLLNSLLSALTLAMSILPEEIPVAFTSFMALGAWRLMKKGIVVKQMKTVETLGSATVICTDKTGTITENKMKLACLYLPDKNLMINAKDKLDQQTKELIRMGMWASEPIPFDPMEVALHQAYTKSGVADERKFYNLVHEYPLEGKPPMMTHVLQNKAGRRIIAAKGAPEAIIQVCRLQKGQKAQAEKAITSLAKNGYRVIGIAEAVFKGHKYPARQQSFNFNFKGLVAFYDPPKNNIAAVLKKFYQAGIKVKMVTGDNPATAIAIAKEVGFKNYDQSITGDELMKMNDDEVKACVMNTTIFARMYPEAKLRIINTLKLQHEIVAMTGDGVNDGPSLKAAHIGIAMGKKGTAIAKDAAALILVKDDLGKMTEAIAMGRKIYANLKKAIQYIISIHIPIILTVLLPLILAWKYSVIFSPVHVILFELVMGPTCSIIFENEPMEKNIMLQRPRPFKKTFFSWKELITSIVQGMVITMGTLFVYQYAVHKGYEENVVRTMVFVTLITANIFLTLVNRSFHYSILTTIMYRNVLIPVIVAVTLLISAVLIYVNPIRDFFEFQYLNFNNLLFSMITGFFSVIWYEIVKYSSYRKNRNI